MPTKILIFTDRPELIESPSWKTATILAPNSETLPINLQEISPEDSLQIITIGESTSAKKIFESEPVLAHEASFHLLSKIESQKVYSMLETTLNAPERPLGLTGWLQPKSTIYFMELFQAQQAEVLWKKSMPILMEKFNQAKATEMQSALLALLTMGVKHLAFPGTRGSGEALQFNLGFDNEKTVFSLAYNYETRKIFDLFENGVLRLLSEMAHCICIRTIHNVHRLEINIVFLHSQVQEARYFCLQNHKREHLQTPMISQQFTFLPLDDVQANINTMETNSKKIFNKTFSETMNRGNPKIESNPAEDLKALESSKVPTLILTDAEPNLVPLRRENEKLQKENQHLHLVNKALVKKIIQMQSQNQTKKEGGEAA